jgi:nucleoredoxin
MPRGIFSTQTSFFLDGSCLNTVEAMLLTRPFCSVYLALLLQSNHYFVSHVGASELAAAEVTEEGVTTPLVNVDANHTVSDGAANASTATAETVRTASPQAEKPITIIDKHPLQTGPLIDIFGQQLLSLEMVNESSAELLPHFTSDKLRGKKVIGVYFSADWCGPCRQFTPELVSFYNKMNNRRGKKNEFEIVWVSRCRDVKAYGQYFTQMGGWVALPPEEAMGERGAMLSEKFKVKGIPTLVLLDDIGEVITLDGRNKIPQDKAGIGFPWRNPLATLYMTLIPRSLRLMVRSQTGFVLEKLIKRVKQVFSHKKKAKAVQV